MNTLAKREVVVLLARDVEGIGDANFAASRLADPIMRKIPLPFST